MLQNFFSVYVLTLLCTFIFSTQSVMSSEMTSTCCDESLEENSQQRRVFHVVSHADLRFSKEGILANIKGDLHPVHSLKRTGSQWLVQVAPDNHDPRYQCSWGHSLCGYCHMCHKTICPDYISRCSASK